MHRLHPSSKTCIICCTGMPKYRLRRHDVLGGCVSCTLLDVDVARLACHSEAASSAPIRDRLIAEGFQSSGVVCLGLGPVLDLEHEVIDRHVYVFLHSGRSKRFSRSPRYAKD